MGTVLIEYEGRETKFSYGNVARKDIREIIGTHLRNWSQEQINGVNVPIPVASVRAKYVLDGVEEVVDMGPFLKGK